MLKVDQKAILNIKGMKVEVKILEIKSAYGRTRYKVTPVAGSGEAVVESVKVK